MGLFDNRAWRKTMLLGVTYVLYLLLGTAIFMGIEAYTGNKTEPDKSTEDIQWHTFLKNASDYLGGDDEVKRALEVFQIKIIEQDVDVPIDDSDGFAVNILNTLLFYFSLISTIGSGTVAPRTAVGRIFSVVYAFIGIPVHVTFMKAFAVGMGSRIRAIMLRVKAKYPNWSNAEYFAIGGCLCVLLTIGLVIPTIIFMQIEGWTSYESLYFCLTTLTTVGLGDYVAGKSLKGKTIYPYYLVMLLTWMIFGLGIIYMIFNLVANVYENTLYKLAKGLNLRPERKTPSDEDISQRELRNDLYNQLIELTEDEATDAHMEQIDWLIGEIEQKSRVEIERMVRTRNAILSGVETLSSS